ncbi:accessory Sec system protein Asp1 [Streptococcus agalactiae]
MELLYHILFRRKSIDISKIPDLYTQIAGISSGIPQINTILTEFVEHRKNGYIIEEIQELEKAIPYYCEQLTNWNRSLIYSIDKINDYTGGQLVERIINSY